MEEYFGHRFTRSSETLGAIYIVRDPRNVVSSLCNHYSMNFNEAYNKMIDENASLSLKNSEGDLSNFSFLGSWSNHYKSWKNNFEFKNYNNGVKNTLTSAIKLANNNIAISGLGGVITIVDFNNDKSISTCIRQDRLGNNAIVEAKNNNLLIIGQKGARLHNMDECYASSMQSTSANAWVETKTN